MTSIGLHLGLLLGAVAVCAGCSAEDRVASVQTVPRAAPFDFRIVATMDNPGIPGTLPVLSPDGSHVAYLSVDPLGGTAEFPWPGSMAAGDATTGQPGLSVFIRGVNATAGQLVSGDFEAVVPRWGAGDLALFFAGWSRTQGWQIYRYGVVGDRLVPLTR